MTPFKWSKEFINEVDETKIQGPLGLSYGIDVLTWKKGDMKLPSVITQNFVKI